MFVTLVYSESTLGPRDLSTDIAGGGDVIGQVISFNVSLYILPTPFFSTNVTSPHSSLYVSMDYFICSSSPPIGQLQRSPGQLRMTLFWHHMNKRPRFFNTPSGFD